MPSPGETHVDENLADRLRTHVERLAGTIGERSIFRPKALAAAAEYIRAEWRRQGHAVEAQGYAVEGLWCENLVVEIPGHSSAGGIILVGAHYDSVRHSPGADDNASGVAALLELGGALAGLRPEKTLRLVAFVNEEPPFFFWGNMGSGEYARTARRRGDDIRIMLSLEMLGYYDDTPGSQRYPPLLGGFYPSAGNYIGFVSNLASRRALREIVAAFRAHSDFPCEQLATFAWVPGVAWSDQLSFWREGYPAVMVTDTAFYRNPHYHSSADTPEKLNYAKMARVAEGLCGAVASLARGE